MGYKVNNTFNFNNLETLNAATNVHIDLIFVKLKVGKLFLNEGNLLMLFLVWCELKRDFAQAAAKILRG